VVIVDVDGVLSDASGRQHNLHGAERDWAAFFEASVDDPPIPEGIRLVEQFCDGRTIVLLTARPARLAPDRGVDGAPRRASGTCSPCGPTMPAMSPPPT
jgi:hypothetical protein